MIYFDSCLCCLNYPDTSHVILHSFFPVILTSCLKIEEYFGSWLSKLFITNTLRELFSIVFFDLFFLSSKCRPRGSCLFIPRSLRHGSELNSQCRGWICVLKLRSLSRWSVVLLVICFERQAVKGGSDSALPCAAILSSVPTRRLEKSKED